MAIRVGHLSTFYHTSVVLMAQGNLEQLLGREVQWKLFGTGPSIIEAFERNEIDMAYIGLPPVIIGIDRGIKIKCVAGGHMEGTVLASLNFMKAYPEAPNIKELLSQFIGFRVGVPGRGSIHDVIIREIIIRSNLEKSIDIVNFKWADEALESFIKGYIIAAAGTPALAIAIKRYGNGKILCPPSMLWPNNPSYGIVVSRRFLDQDRDIIERFLRIHEDITALFRNRPEEASAIISRFIGVVDADFVLDTIMVSPRYYAQLTEDYINATMRFVRVMKRLGYITRDIETEEIFETGLIRDIHGLSNHY